MFERGCSTVLMTSLLGHRDQRRPSRSHATVQVFRRWMSDQVRSKAQMASPAKLLQEGPDLIVVDGAVTHMIYKDCWYVGQHFA